MPRQKRQTPEDGAARAERELARKEARAQWIADNPEAHAQEQAAIKAAQAERVAHLEGE